MEVEPWILFPRLFFFDRIKCMRRDKDKNGGQRERKTLAKDLSKGKGRLLYDISRGGELPWSGKIPWSEEMSRGGELKDDESAARKRTHYFSEDAKMEDSLRYFDYEVNGKKLSITSNSGVFSKNHVDKGSELLIRTVMKEESDRMGNFRIADIGSGYGILLLALLTCYPQASGAGIEISNRATRLARINAKKNRMRERAKFLSGDVRKPPENEDEAMPGSFRLVVTNPPIRAGKEVVYACFDYGYRLLEEGGRLYIVISKYQGAASAKTYLEERFGSAEIIAKESEFRIIRVVKAKANDGI